MASGASEMVGRLEGDGGDSMEIDGGGYGESGWGSSSEFIGSDDGAGCSVGAPQGLTGHAPQHPTKRPRKGWGMKRTDSQLSNMSGVVEEEGPAQQGSLSEVEARSGMKQDVGVVEGVAIGEDEGRSPEGGVEMNGRRHEDELPPVVDATGEENTSEAGNLGDAQVLSGNEPDLAAGKLRSGEQTETPLNISAKRETDHSSGRSKGSRPSEASAPDQKLGKEGGEASTKDDDSSPSSVLDVRSDNCATVHHGSLLRRSLETLFSPLYTLFGTNEVTSISLVPSLSEGTVDSQQDRDAAAQAESSQGTRMDLSGVKVEGTTTKEIPIASTTESSSNSPSLGDDQYIYYSFIASLPPLASIANRPTTRLPTKSDTAKKVTLVLDLDETLVHCATDPLVKAELEFTVTFRDLDYRVFARKRPHFDEFIREVSKIFEVVIFTASHKIYAEKLLDLLDPRKEWSHHRCYRESCVEYSGNYLKDLTVLGRDLQTTAIVDNSLVAFGFQVENGIPIESWIDRDDDEELLKLLPFLRELSTLDDVRPRISQQFRIQDRVDEMRKNKASDDFFLPR